VPVLRQQASSIDALSELADLIPPLGRRLSALPEKIESNPEGQRYRLFEAVASFLEAAARTRPLILILEDIHWADRPTLLLLRHLLRSSHEGPVLMIATYRETELDRKSPLFEILSDLRREPASTRLLLRGLAPEHIGRFITASIGQEPPTALTRLVVENTEGNPFFVSEVLRHLKEAGALDHLKGGGVDLAVEEFGLPEGVRETIGRRLTRLSEPCNRIFGIAAVIGREFDFSILRAVAEIADDPLLDAIDEGVGAHLIQEVPASPGRYTFTHALIRETLYGELTSVRRIRMHHRIAGVLERFAAPGHKPLADLAYHYTQAASAGDPEKAIGYAIEAAEHASARFALEDAARFYDMALDVLDLLPHSPHNRTRKLDLRFRRGRAFGDVGQWALAKPELEMALELLEPDEQELRCKILMELTKTSFWLMDIPNVRRFATEALPIAEALGRNDLTGDALAWLGAALGSDGDPLAAGEINRKAVKLAGGVSSLPLSHLTISSYWIGRAQEVIEMSSEAVATARAESDPGFHMFTLGHFGLSLATVGRYDEAARTFEEMREFGRRYGVLPLLARGISMSTVLPLALADFPGAEKLALEARDLARQVNFVPPVVSAGIDLLVIYARSHEPGRAEELLDEVARSVVNGSGFHGWLWRLRLWQARAEIAYAEGDWNKAVEAANHSIEEGHLRHRVKYEALGLATRARARLQLAQTPLAIEDVSRAVTLARNLGDPAVLIDTLALQLILDGNDALASEAKRTVDQVLSKLSNPRLRKCFLDSESVKLVLRS
jgi:tetratricopeptide (TPR) repeat protein